MRKKEITMSEFTEKLNNLTFKDTRKETEKYFILKGGRGFITVLNKMLYEFTRLTQISELPSYVGYIKNVFIPGLGFFEIQYDAKFDKGVSREINQKLINGLPEFCYHGELFDKEKSLGFITTLIEAPYQNIDDLLKGLNSTIVEFEQKISDFKKELSNLENGK